jgi:hypothetical protein
LALYQVTINLNKFRGDCAGSDSQITKDTYEGYRGRRGKMANQVARDMFVRSAVQVYGHGGTWNCLLLRATTEQRSSTSLKWNSGGMIGRSDNDEST